MGYDAAIVLGGEHRFLVNERYADESSGSRWLWRDGIRGDARPGYNERL